MRPLVCTLGLSWMVIAEAFAFVHPERCPLYKQGTRDLTLMIPALLRDWRPDELWVITTSGAPGIERIQTWWRGLGSPGELRIFRTLAGDGAAQREVELIRELIMRVVLSAGADAVLSLSGGRKTMSADLQRAGMLFGCRSMIHVLPPEPLPQSLKSDGGADFLSPLLPIVADGIQLVLVGQGRRNDLLGIRPAITADHFPIPPGNDFDGPGQEGWLWQAVDAREREGGRLLTNFHAEVVKSERHENWRCLYRMPPATIDTLRSQIITDKDLPWLHRLPKADLHCHLGGILDLQAQRRVAASVWDSLTEIERNRAEMALTKVYLNKPARWSKQLKDCKKDRPLVVAAIFRQHDDEYLSKLLWDPAIERVGLKDSKGFKVYELPGELSGSAILSHPAAVHATAREVLAYARGQGLSYLELRGSPSKYVDGFLAQFHQSLKDLSRPGDPLVRFLVCIDRCRKGGTLQDHIREIRRTVEMAIDGRERLDGFVVGVDLAGDEKRGKPQQLAKGFSRAFESCLSITIHAGEGQPAEMIWQAAYHLHADRIGHGLTLSSSPILAEKFLNRHICLEMCPTSNREVVGFRDDSMPTTANLPIYPLRSLMDHGLAIGICTDNPGISRTSPEKEYIAASRMVTGGISRWEVLSLVKQAYLHSFLPPRDRENLIKTIDVCIADLISDHIP